MKNIKEIVVFKSSVKVIDQGVIISLSSESNVSQNDSLNFEKDCLIATYLYDENEMYKVIYSILRNNGSLTSYEEEEGILPTLFRSPSNKAYVSISPYNPDKELEINLPIFDRESIQLPKGKRPFVGDFVSSVNQCSIFYYVDIWSKKKPDRMQLVYFENDVLIKKKLVKIPFPKKNKIFIENNEIHLLAKEDDYWIHRLINEEGNVVRKRRLDLKSNFVREVINLSFETNSYLLAEDKEAVQIERIDTNGLGMVVNEFKIGHELFNTWRPTKINEDTVLLNYNFENGNGWFTIKNGIFLEAVISKNDQGYIELIKNKTIVKESQDLIIAGVHKCDENSYWVVFYPRTNHPEKYKEIHVLNRYLPKA